MRGTPYADGADLNQLGIIPAYAGNTNRRGESDADIRDHPRICGEHGEFVEQATPRLGSSPHMRGTLTSGCDVSIRIGIIPAYAGNTLRDYSNFVVSKFMSFVFHLV